MLTKLHSSLEGIDLGHAQANVLVRALLDRAQTIRQQAEEGSPFWFDEMKNVLHMATGMEEGGRSIKAFVLAVVEPVWEKLPLEIRAEYNYSFDVFTVREAGIQPTTADNYIRAANTFYFNEKAPKLGVQIPERDKEGRVVVENNEPVMKTVEFDPTKVPISKLALMTHAANSGEMEAGQRFSQGWGMLMDDKVTTTDLQKLLYGVGEGNGNGHHDDPSLTYTLEGDIIVATEMGKSFEIAELFSDVAGRDPDAARIYRDILRRLGIRCPEDELAKKLEEAGKQSLMRVYMNGGAKLIGENDETEGE